MTSLWTVVAPCANMRAMTTTVPETEVPDEEEVLAEVLVEEISIDGMCGVY
jgi:mycofactocin precursor